MDRKLVRSLRREMKSQEGGSSPSSKNVDVQLAKTSFQRYLQQKDSRFRGSCKYKTAANTPSRLASPPSFD